MKGTRILHSVNLNPGKYAALKEQADLLGQVRSEVWQRFGSLRGVGVNHREIRTDWVKNKDFSPLPAKAWKETLRDALDDIRLYEASAKEKVRKQIARRFNDPAERKHYFGLLRSHDWVSDPLLSRWMRKAKKHGRNHTFNQIILENGVYSQFQGKDGNTWLKVPSLVKGKRLAIPLNSKVKLQGMLRLILIDGRVEVHYLAKGKQHKPCGTEVIGVDKGYSEVFADSDGAFHGEGFNHLLTPISQARMENNRARNKLFQIAEKSSAKKKARIYKNNLGTKKRVQQNRKIKQQIRTHCFKAAHSVVDKAAEVIAEDLTSPIPKKNQWKQFNRLMNSWMKGAITEALEKVTKLRGSELHYINAAYTSQIDSTTHHLQGNRVGDKFYHVNGEVSHADINAACNIKHRYIDKAITRYMPYRQVKRILLDRLHASKELSGAAQAVLETVPSGL
ncbi:MAG: transposase [Methyloprofundus sp.]|nr:transposase [Methyloprofundus sp.]